MLENPMVTGLAAHQSRQEVRDALALKAYQALRAELVTALFANPLTPIAAPAYVPDRQRAIDVVADLACSDDSSLLESMLRLVTTCAEGEDPGTRLPAQAIIARLAHRHAAIHADDLAHSEGFGDAA